jgi:mono/diheme cytochrome c family protein
MQKRIWRVLAIVLFGLAMAQHGPSAQDRSANRITVSKRVYDKRLLLAKPQLSEAALKGRALWVQRCAYCHDGVGTPTYKTLGPWIDAETVRAAEGEAFVRQQIAKGSPRMPGFQYTLKPEQVDEIIAFLKSVTPDQKPTADELSKSPPTEAPTTQ